MSSPSSGCQSTPNANRCDGSSTASIVPSSACAATGARRRRARSPGGGALHRRVVAEDLGEPRSLLERDVVVGERARRVLVLVVADHVGQMLDEVAAARDVQHLAAAANGQDRHVACQRAVEQCELRAVALRHDAEGLVVRLLVVEIGIEVRAAREEKPVDSVQRLLMPSSLGGIRPAARRRARSRARRQPARARPLRPSSSSVPESRTS